MKPSRRVFLQRALPAAVLFAGVQVYVDRTFDWKLRDVVTRQGEAAGCTVFRPRYYVIGQNGPFFGDDLKHDAWNFAWRNVTLVTSCASGLGAAGALYVVCTFPLGRTRVFGYRGPTRCGRCGYTLAGLREPKCPECGQAV